MLLKKFNLVGGYIKSWENVYVWNSERLLQWNFVLRLWYNIYISFSNVILCSGSDSSNEHYFELEMDFNLDDALWLHDENRAIMSFDVIEMRKTNINNKARLCYWYLFSSFLFIIEKYVSNMERFLRLKYVSEIRVIVIDYISHCHISQLWSWNFSEKTAEETK